MHHILALKKYGEEKGTCNIPQNDSYECVLEGVDDNGGDIRYKGNLGMWLKDQRAKQIGRKKPALTAEQEAMLQELVDQGTYFTMNQTTIMLESFTLLIACTASVEPSIKQ